MYLLAKGETTSLEAIESQSQAASLTISEKREMLYDYFSIEIDSDGNLTTLPILVDGHVPSWGQLPRFIYSLALDVDWSRELACFRSLGRVIAEFYSSPKFDTSEVKAGVSESGQSIDYLIFSFIKKSLKPSNELFKHCNYFKTNVFQLYRVFERC
jgi:DNA mismatch repair protein MLH1